MADLILPNGQTIQSDNPAIIAEFMARGAQSQSDVLAQNPGQDIRQIANDRGMAWNSQGGEGYLNAMRQGLNDPTSDPTNPQPFSQQALQQYNNGAGLGGGLLGNGGGGGLLGGGSNVGSTLPGYQMPTISAPTTSPIASFSSAPANPLSVQPTIPSFQQQPQTFADILGKYDNFRVPMPTGGINWLSPSVSPGQVNVMDANISRRYL